MEYLNQTLFLWINGSDPSSTSLFLGKILAKYLVYIFPLFLIYGWLRFDSLRRQALIQAVITTSLAIFMSWLIAKFWFSPRPFVIGIGQQFLEHKATASFPSNHLSFIWGICAGLFVYQKMRKTAVLLAIIGLPVAWARIFMGVHWPLDMLGACINAVLAALICLPLKKAITPAITQALEAVYRPLFAWLINTGLARK